MEGTKVGWGQSPAKNEIPKMAEVLIEGTNCGNKSITERKTLAGCYKSQNICNTYLGNNLNI
jgi:hypothetical protein